MNPPLRSAEDREALIEGLADGTIDAIATDHAPHSAEEKARGLEHSAMGIVGLETAFAVVYTSLVRSGRVSLNRVVEALTSGPNEAFGLCGAGSGAGCGVGCGFGVGAAADLVVIDIDHEYCVDSSSFLSMGRATPFEGRRVFGRVLMTVKGGRVVYGG